VLPWFRPNRKKLQALTGRGETAAAENRWEDAANSFRRAVEMAPKLRDADEAEAAALQIQARG
jgi:hypothetical protein